MNVANVVVLDDDSFVRSSLSAGLSAFGIRVIGSTSNISSTLEIMQNNQVDVVVVDLDLGPGPNGLDICQHLRSKFPNLGLVMLTSYTNPKIADPKSLSLPKGCRFISKSNLSDFTVLVNSIIMAKNKPLAHTPKITNDNSLTSTQLEVLKMVADGLTSSEIAKIRGVSQKAIENTISKIHTVLKLTKSKRFNQRVQLTRFYFSLSGKKPPGA